MGKDTNQNMEGWQQPDPQQDDWQQPVPQGGGQPAGSSPTGLQPTPSYASRSQKTCFPHGVSSVTALKLKCKPKTPKTQVGTHPVYNARLEEDDNPSHPTLNDIPNEVLTIIMSYLTFKERCRFGWTNTRLRALPMIPGFWRLVKIQDTALSCTLVTTIIKMGTKLLRIPRCYLQGNWLEIIGLENFMIGNASGLEHLDLAGFEGDDSLAATLVYMSKKLTVLNLSESRFALMASIINRLPMACTITALDLSAIGDHTHPEWGDVLPYETVRLLVDKCHQLTDLILLGLDNPTHDTSD